MPVDRGHSHLGLQGKECPGRGIGQLVGFGFDPAEFGDHRLYSGDFPVTKSRLDQFVEFVDHALALITGGHHPAGQGSKGFFER